MPDSQHILLAEDDVQYALVIQLALKQAGIDDPVHLVTSRDDVIAYMAGQGPYADRAAHPIPTAIILATRLPLLEDFKALRWIRRHHQYDHIPVVVLSGVEYDDERGLARRLGADCYHAKPSNYDGLLAIARRIRESWLEPGQHQAAA